MEKFEAAYGSSNGVGSERRKFLRTAAAAGALGLAGVGARQVLAAPPVRNLKLAWNTNAVCLSAAPVAVQRGIFEKHGLNVELVNFSGSTDQLLEAIATGKADAGVGMIHRWLKPLESGFDVKLVGSSQFRMQMGGFQAQQPPFGAHPGEGQPDQAKGGGTTIEGEFERKE